MNRTYSKRRLHPLAIMVVATAATVLGVPAAFCQTSSLYQRDIPLQRGPAYLPAASWIHVDVPPPKELKLHDIVTVRVDVSSRVQSEGEFDRRKNASYDAAINDWIRLDGLRGIKPTGQAAGDPRIKGSLTQLFRAEGEMETSESLRFDIASEVVDIRPNGTIVLQAHRQVTVNDEVWEQSLTGICRIDDIGPDNVILSRNISDLRVEKRERGHVRDGYRRGWFLRWFDWAHPF